MSRRITTTTTTTTLIMNKSEKILTTTSCSLIIFTIIINLILIEFVSSSFLHNKLTDATNIQRQNDHSNEQADSVNLISNLQSTPNRAALSSSNKKLVNSNNDMLVHEREYVSPQVKVQMECQRDKTIIKVNFTKPFSGILGSGRLDTTKCKLNGNGTRYYEISVNHNASQCDTQWDNANNSIINTLFIRFHPSLETGSDIAKNIMCRLTVGDLVVGRRPLKQQQQQQLQQTSRNSNNSSTGSLQKIQSQLTDVVASNSVSTINEQAI